MRFRARLFLIAFLIIGTLGAAFYLKERTSPTVKTEPMEKLVLATPQIPFSSLLFLAKRNNLFAKHGLDVQLVVTTTGKEALEMTLAGKADVAAVATLPLAHAVANGATPRILAVISKSESEHSLVARRDRGIAKPADLKNKTIGILAGTSAQFYLEAMLTNSNVDRNTVHMKSLTPESSQNAIVSGEVDAVALFSPWDRRAAKALGESGIVFQPTLHTTHWTLTSNVSFANIRSTAAQKLLLTVLEAQAFTVEQHAASLDIVATEMNIPRADLDKYWGQYTFDLELPQSLIVTLEREIQWIGSHGNALATDQTAYQTPPDFLNYISFSALQLVKPSAIKITR